MPLTIIAAYAPTAASTDDKQEFYNEIERITIEQKAKNIIIAAGDFNARLQVKQEEYEDCIGPHTFDQTRELEQSDEVEDNRSRFVAYCQSNELIIATTWFKKSDKKLATWKAVGQERNQEQWIRPKFETLDYICISKIWRNILKNCEGDPAANLTSDHFLLWCKIK